MIDAKAAATVAIKYFNDFYAGSGFSDVKVEEVELTDDNKWLITLGYFDPRKDDPSPLVFTYGKRKYKIFSIDQDGVVKSMKIRSVE